MVSYKLPLFVPGTSLPKASGATILCKEGECLLMKYAVAPLSSAGSLDLLNFCLPGG